MTTSMSTTGVLPGRPEVRSARKLARPWALAARTWTKFRRPCADLGRDAETDPPDGSGPPNRSDDGGGPARAGYAEIVKLPAKYRNVARHKSRKGTPGDPDELRSCQKVAGQLSNRCRTTAPVAAIRPIFDQHTRQAGSRLAKCWPRLLKVGQYLANIGHFGSLLAQIGPSWPNIGHIRPDLAEFGQMLATYDQIGPRSSQNWPKLCSRSDFSTPAGRPCRNLLLFPPLLLKLNVSSEIVTCKGLCD